MKMDKWEVFKCQACPPDSKKKWDLALLYEHFAKSHMNSFHIYKCPKCERRLATAMCAKFHMDKCGVDKKTEVTAYMKNVMDVSSADFQKLHEGVVASIKLHTAEMMKERESTEVGVQTVAPEVSDDDIIMLSDDDDIFLLEDVDKGLKEMPRMGGNPAKESMPEKTPSVDFIPHYQPTVCSRNAVIQQKPPSPSQPSSPSFDVPHSTMPSVAPFKMHFPVKVVPGSLATAPRPAAKTIEHNKANERAPLPYFQKETENTDVIITLRDTSDHQISRDLYFHSKYLMKFSDYFAKMLHSSKVNKKRLFETTEYTQFLEAMAAFHQKEIPDFNLLCDRVNGNGMCEEKRLLNFCRVVEHYDLKGALFCDQLKLFDQMCPQQWQENDCPHCINRIAVALRYKIPIPKNVRFSRQAADKWTAAVGTVAHRLNNVDAVLQWLKTSG